MVAVVDSIMYGPDFSFFMKAFVFSVFSELVLPAKGLQ